MDSWLKQRSAAVLLHISSLPGPFAKGVLGPEAREFIDLLAEAGYKIWQFLPLGPTHDHGSPYESLSSFAGNPDFLDLRQCVDSGWLGGIRQDQTHAEQRQLASQGFWQSVANNAELAASVALFEQAHQDWLKDFALFK